MNKTLPHYNGSNPTMLLQSDSWLQFCAYAVSWIGEGPAKLNDLNELAVFLLAIEDRVKYSQLMDLAVMVWPEIDGFWYVNRRNMGLIKMSDLFARPAACQKCDEQNVVGACAFGLCESARNCSFLGGNPTLIWVQPLIEVSSHNLYEAFNGKV